MSTSTSLINRIKDKEKPGQLRLIFVLYLIKIILAFTAFTIFTIKGKSVNGVGAEIILYTAFGYIASFLALAYFILTKNLKGMRAVIVVDFIISLPSRAYVGLAFAVIAFALSWHSKVKQFFAKPY